MPLKDYLYNRFGSPSGSYKELCSEESYREQPAGKAATGVLVSHRVIATAGHVRRRIGNFLELRFLFGYRMLDPTTPRLRFNNSEIYSAKRVVKEYYELPSDCNCPENFCTCRPTLDWALIELDRKVTNHKPVECRTEGKIPVQQSVYMYGYPYGLPMKLAAGARVYHNDEESPFFSANLDAFDGNSGSPVFNSHTHVLEGILSHGGESFYYDSNADCFKMSRCNDVGFPTRENQTPESCRGEYCTRTTEFVQSIPIDFMDALPKWWPVLPPIIIVIIYLIYILSEVIPRPNPFLP